MLEFETHQPRLSKSLQPRMCCDRQTIKSTLYLSVTCHFCLLSSLGMPIRFSKGKVFSHISSILALPTCDLIPKHSNPSSEGVDSAACSGKWNYQVVFSRLFESPGSNHDGTACFISSLCNLKFQDLSGKGAEARQWTLTEALSFYGQVRNQVLQWPPAVQRALSLPALKESCMWHVTDFEDFPVVMEVSGLWCAGL